MPFVDEKLARTKPGRPHLAVFNGVKDATGWCYTERNQNPEQLPMFWTRTREGDTVVLTP